MTTKTVATASTNAPISFAYDEDGLQICASPCEEGSLCGCPEDHAPWYDDAGWADDVMCEERPEVDEICVDHELEIGRALGQWLPVLNDCQTFAQTVLQRSRPQSGAYAPYCQ